MFARRREDAKKVVHAEARRLGGVVLGVAVGLPPAGHVEGALTGSIKPSAAGSLFSSSAPRREQTFFFSRLRVNPKTFCRPVVTNPEREDRP